MDRKALLKGGLERGRAEFLAGRVLMRESVSKATLDNALEWVGGQGAFAIDESGKRTVAAEWRDQASTHLVEEIDGYLLA